MGIFNSTFRQHIIDELNSRKSHEGRQQAYHPTARVTALVRGKFSDPRLSRLVNNQQFTGFSLGPIDINKSNSLDKLTNISGKGSVIGITYTDGKAQEVTIRSKKNLPSPGVTNITISTQSKGGLVFKATANFKFYGKEQYDIIYQTFMRPGNPILLEFGHTKTEESVKQFNNLGFFVNLEDNTVNEIADDIRQVSKLQATRSAGYVAGLVSNFKIKLNENNEYEASIDIINALEFLYTLPPEDTFLSYADPTLSNSIKNNFGFSSEDEYNSDFDRVFQQVEKDRNVDIDPNTAATEKLQYLENPKINSILFTSEVTTGLDIEDALSEYTVQAGRTRFSNLGRGDTTIIPQSNKQADFTYVSLLYVLNEMLPVILKQTVFVEENNCLSNTIQSFDQIQKEKKYYRENLDGGGVVFGKLASRGEEIQEERLRINAQQQYENVPLFDRTMFIFEPIKYWQQLRSTNIRDVIINNEKLYEGNYYKSERLKSYKKKFDIPDKDDLTANWFKINSAWETKEKYSENNFGRGIFINYQKVRNAFVNSSSVSEAIVRILDLISNSTNGVLKLKMKNISSDKFVSEENVVESYKLTIYDENSLPNKNDVGSKIYEFFTDNIAEAVSYDFDFNLPSSVASTIVANNFTNNTNITGESESYQLLYNGMDNGIESMIPSNSQTGSADIMEYCKTPLEIALETTSNTNGNTNTPDREEQLQKELGEFYSTIIGYQELTPPSMRSQIIGGGLFNTLPTSARVSIKLVGIDGFRFGDMFGVRNMLPYPYDENNIFMLTGYKHDINSDGWYTTIDGIMIASTPPEKRPFTDKQLEMLDKVANLES